MVIASVLLNPEDDTVSTVPDALADLVPDEIRQTQDTTAPDALIGVRESSSHDSETMFSIGID